MRLRSLLAPLVLAAGMAALPALAQTKARPKTPPPAPAPVVSKCDAPPPAVRDMATERFYRDPKNSIPDTVIVAKNKAALGELDRTLWRIITWSNLWLARKDTGAAGCALGWMAAWAKDGAMLGTMSGRQAEYDRKWRTAGLSIAYLKLKSESTPEQAAAIGPWLVTLAQKAVESEAAVKNPNNHRYWAGLAATAAGFAAGNDSLVTYGRAAFLQAMAAITPEGALPRELERGQLALHYHNYALAPLVMSAEIAARHGQDWYADAAPLHRLAAYTLAGIAQPDTVAQTVGARQKVPSGGILGWQAPYARRFPDRLTLKPGQTFDYSWLGGDITGFAASAR